MSQAGKNLCEKKSFGHEKKVDWKVLDREKNVKKVLDMGNMKGKTLNLKSLGQGKNLCENSFV